MGFENTKEHRELIVYPFRLRASTQKLTMGV